MKRRPYQTRLQRSATWLERFPHSSRASRLHAAIVAQVQHDTADALDPRARFSAAAGELVKAHPLLRLDDVRVALALAAVSWLAARYPEDDPRAEPELTGARGRERIPQLRRRLRDNPADDAAAYELFAIERRTVEARRGRPHDEAVDRVIELLLVPWRRCCGEPTQNEGPRGALTYLNTALRVIGVSDSTASTSALRKRLARRRAV